MNSSRLTSAVVALAASFAFAIPVLAAQDGHRGGGRARAEGQGQSQARAQAVPRAAAPRTVQPQQRFEQPRAIQPQQRFEQPRAFQSQQRFEQPRGIQPQQRFAQPRAFQPQQRFDDRRFDQRGFVRPQVIRPGFGGGAYYRPYYTFRPRLSLGFGLWLGYPILYSSYGPSYYPSPYAYSSPYAQSTYPVPAPGTVAPTLTGGLSFDISPSDAGLYVDGQYIGTVGQFSPSEQPLPLTPGRHRLEIGAQGYRTLAFDVDIIAGQVIPYQGAMQPQ